MTSWRRGLEGLVILAALLLAACGKGHEAQASVQTPAAVSAPAGAQRILVLGDSLSAAYNLRSDEGWVALIEQRLRRENRRWTMVNASISGETTAGGLARIDAALRQHQPKLVVLELGANDGLRGLPVAEMQANLDRMAEAATNTGAKVLVIGMRMPPNYGLGYTRDFFAAFEAVADTHNAAYLPFLLEPIALDRDAFQDDGLHPDAEAQPLLADHVWPVLETLLEE